MMEATSKDRSKVFIEEASNQARLSSGDHSACSRDIVLNWSISAISGSPKDLFLSQIVITVAHVLWFSCISYLMRDMIEREMGFFISITTLIIGLNAGAICIMRQKTLYRYQIHRTRARLVYRLHYPKYAREFFKGFALVGIFLLILMALMAGSLLFLTGVGAMAFMAAMRLLTWKNPIKREWSGPWDEYNFVTVDRKRRVVVTHITDKTLGFEARLPDDALFEQYLAFLRSVLPPTAQFTEKKWDMSLI